MYKRCIQARRVGLARRKDAVVGKCSWISEKINIKEHCARLVAQCTSLEEIGLRLPAKAGLVASANPDPRPSTSFAEPVPVIDLEGDQPSEPKKPRATPKKQLVKPGKRKRKRRPKPSAKTLKYLELYDDFRSGAKRETCDIEDLVKVSIGKNVGPATSMILPEGVLQLIPEESKLETIKLAKTPEGLKRKKCLVSKFDRTIYQETGQFDPTTVADLFPGETIVVEVRIYWPNLPKAEWKRKQDNPKISQVIVMLGSQTLTDLRDKIMCIADMTLPVECSKDPLNVPKHTAKDVYKSGLFFINDAFYSDLRDPANIDYSEVIRKWTEQKNIGQFEAHIMECTKMEDLTVQLGEPYLYQHQGNCEHLLVISDIRLLNGLEPRSSLEYPYVKYESCPRAKTCYMCGRYAAQWLTANGGRVPYNPTYYCQRCFLSFNYVDGKNVGEFKAYHFTEPVYIP